jgi:hypothetical protein
VSSIRGSYNDRHPNGLLAKNRFSNKGDDCPSYRGELRPVRRAEKWKITQGRCVSLVENMSAAGVTGQALTATKGRWPFLTVRGDRHQYSTFASGAIGQVVLAKTNVIEQAVNSLKNPVLPSGPVSNIASIPTAAKIEATHSLLLPKPNCLIPVGFHNPLLHNRLNSLGNTRTTPCPTAPGKGSARTSCMTRG